MSEQRILELEALVEQLEEDLYQDISISNELFEENQELKVKVRGLELIVQELVEAMNDLLYEYEDLILRLPCSTPVRGQPIYYNSQAAKQAENLLTKAKEVLGDESGRI